ncbi:MAG: hypothetical protein H7A43_08720 [Verrucomicrobia bacterium]|nr:hypothetical protein [Verrucomicrobiota bacterium]
MMNPKPTWIERNPLWVTLLMSLVVWAILTWPLPRHLGTTIPAGMTHADHETRIAGNMPGDHMQLLYHFWLFADMVSGHTPWFYNLYEFNTGSDAETYMPGSYYVPFSMLFTAGYWMGGQAFGWNFAGFLSIWLTAYFTWLLIRRFTQCPAAILLGCLAALLLPYRWHSLLGGSPTGFGMTLVPLVFLGIDMAVREEKIRGGILAGVAILLACWSDTHVYFFATLVAPAWGILALVQRRDIDWLEPKTWIRWSLALLPVLIFIAISFSFSKLTASHIQESTTSAGRTLQEVALFSPHADGLFNARAAGISHQIYLGYGYAAIALMGFGLLGFRVCQPNCRIYRPLALLLLLTLATAGIIALALGPNGPFEGRALLAVRKLIPPYTMIRQPAKIYALLPSVLAVMTAISVGVCSTYLKSRWMRVGVYTIIAGLLIAEQRGQMRPVLSMLDADNGAYTAVADDAEQRDLKARAVVVTLWPGDSHYTSLYQYFASIHRIRLANGYRPFVPQAYKEHFYSVFETVNRGNLLPEQVDALLDRGIEYLLIHEDLYPEKVSPFPIGFVLKQYFHHPRLRLLERDGPVWAFRLLREERTVSPIVEDWKTWIPARSIEAEAWKRHGGTSLAGDDASGGQFVRFENQGDILWSTMAAITDADQLRWSLRVRGHGKLRIEIFVQHQSAGELPLMIDSDDWTWMDIPMPQTDPHLVHQFGAEWVEGSVDLDHGQLIAGASLTDLFQHSPDGHISLPAALFFHAGETDTETQGVVFTADYHRDGIVFYGPRLPLEPGRYRIRVDATSEAPDGATYGEWAFEQPRGVVRQRFPMAGSETLDTTIDLPSNLPWQLVFVRRTDDALSIRSVEIERLK